MDTGPIFQLDMNGPPTEARVYFYMPGTAVNEKLSIKVNQQDVIDLYKNTYTWVGLKPGYYELSARWRDKRDLSIYATLKAGKIYFVEVFTYKEGNMINISIAGVSYDEQKEIISRTHFLESVNNGDIEPTNPPEYKPYD